MLYSDSRLTTSLMEKRQEDRARIGPSRDLGAVMAHQARRLAALVRSLTPQLHRVRPEPTNKLVLD